jgi:hypothetical protein
MGIAADSQTTKAVEWVLERLTTASQSGFIAEKISSLTSSSPAYLTTASRPTLPASDGGVSTAAVDALFARVAKLEKELEALRASHEHLVSAWTGH